MNFKKTAPSLLLSVLAATCCGAARADGLADLRTALARLQGQAPLKANAQARDWRRTGEGKEAKETQGQATIVVEDGPRGLQPLYSHDLLARVDAELRAAAKDKSAPKPLSQALGQLGFNELRALSSAGLVLQREIDETRFKGETVEAWAGKPARKLQFEGGVDRLSDSDRKYVRDYKLVLSVWIGADGTPLASLRHFDVSGRAFVVVTFEQHSDLQRSYAVAGDRLVATSDEEKGSAKGAGETQEYRIERSLQVLPERWRRIGLAAAMNSIVVDGAARTATLGAGAKLVDVYDQLSRRLAGLAADAARHRVVGPRDRHIGVEQRHAGDPAVGPFAWQRGPVHADLDAVPRGRRRHAHVAERGGSDLPRRDAGELPRPERVEMPSRERDQRRPGATRDPTLENWQAAYYGANYERLRQVKTAYDPTRVFNPAQGVEPA